jgi:hypothetical protein
MTMNMARRFHRFSRYEYHTGIVGAGSHCAGATGFTYGIGNGPAGIAGNDCIAAVEPIH